MRSRIFTTVILASALLASNITSNAQSWNVTGNTAATNNSILGATTANVNLRLYAGNLERIRIMGSNGNVGIGTIAPATKFHVVGTSRLQGATAIIGATTITGNASVSALTTTGTFKMTGGTPGVNKILSSDATGLATWVTAASVESDPQVGSNTTGRIPRWNGSSLVSGAIYDNGTQVGIGTTAPAAHLEIQGNPASTQTNFYAKVNYAGNTDVRAVGAFSVPALGYGVGVYAVGGYNGVEAHSDAGTYLGAAYGISSYAFGSAGAGPRFAVYGFASGGSNNWGVYSNGATYSTAGYISSDAKLKNEVQPIGNALAKIDRLKPRTYKFRTAEYDYMGLPSEKQYGFIAQELEEVLPELVKNIEQPINHNDKKYGMLQFKAINYTELIPLLTQGMQELKAQVEEQKTQNQELRTIVKELESALSQCCTNYSPAKSELGNSLIPSEKPVLEQNAPNPFSQETTIRYYLPSKSTGILKVMSLEGHEITTKQLTAKGFGEVRITGSSLAAGTYTYTLIVDGRAIESKIMVLTK